jgi:hypothetical protein
VVGKRPDDDPLGQGWGRGEQNAFGIYEYYVYPEGHGKPGYTWNQVLEDEEVIEADFEEHYNIDLRKRWKGETVRWYRVRLSGLMSIDSRLARTLTGRYDLYDDEEEFDE